jgi:zinc transporter, ZIP family
VYAQVTSFPFRRPAPHLLEELLLLCGGCQGFSRVALPESGYQPGMGQAIVFGVIASSALVLGALVGGRFQFPKRVLAAMLSFAAGALVTALTFEMFQDSYEQGGIWRAALGLAVGAVVFTVVSLWLDRMAEGHRKDDHGSEKLDLDAAAKDAPPSPASVSGAAGLALLAAATLDGIPENLVLGVALGEGSGGVALLAAIFAANFPEALVSSASMREQGRSQAFILGTWTVCAVLLIFAVLVGAGPLSRATHETLSLPLAFAAGAVLAALADTLMPEAYEHGGPTVALSTAAGFMVAYVLSLL